jgi:hypothetical protein
MLLDKFFWDEECRNEFVKKSLDKGFLALG